ncbi:sterol 26-hydroxylase, mitochondrial [Microcaecilia unicolor]|uniref:Sterol 26-hydroxylase, mitochondrial-like n=1 Tax=Microcaecilia unicolor TaxID=1415580 RepID=A0A6P7YMV3_9AMPH|nr:sterol 26-hydroxylase, mitochondrial-like [Microcaecilia unicolor]
MAGTCLRSLPYSSRPIVLTVVRCASKATSWSLQSDKNSLKLKTMEDLPGPSLATTAYWLFVKGYQDKSHAMQVEHKKLYGPIWRSRFGHYNIINVASAELIEQVVRQEGKYPVRSDLPHWREYRDMRGQAYGIHVDYGDQWYRIRTTLNPKMLKLKEVSQYSPTVHEVVSDLLKRIHFLRRQDPSGVMVPNLTDELYKFGFEGISAILFETRLGCLDPEIPEGTQRFIKAVGDMLRLSETVIFLPRWTRPILPFWKKFVQAWDDISDVSKKLIDQKVQDISEKLERDEPVEGDFLTYVISSKKLSLPEIYTSISELLLGGVDTTSNTLSWALYQLAQNPAVQDQLLQEIEMVCPGEQLPSSQDVGKMQYLKAVIKETLRLYPVVPGNGRWVVENEIVVDDYFFPKKTQFHLCHYAASHEEKHFPEPSKFRPERWLRGEEKFKHHPFSSIPFGVGLRACVGKRVAELEMYFALSRIMKEFRVLPDPAGGKVEPKTRTLMIPGSPINLQFFSRK